MKAYAAAIAARTGSGMHVTFSFTVLVLPDCASIEDAREQALAIARERWPTASLHEAALASISAVGEPREWYPTEDVFK